MSRRFLDRFAATLHGEPSRVFVHYYRTAASAEAVVAPTADQISTLIGCLKTWTRRSPLLVHCRAGIGRSTATAFIAACLHNPNTDELAIARALRTASSLARPNQRLVELADAALGREGRMVAAIEETGRGLSWDEVMRALHTHGEGVPFEMPSAFGMSAGTRR